MHERPSPRSAPLLALACALAACGGGAGDAPVSRPDSLPRACIRTTACGVQRTTRLSACVEFYSKILVPQGEGAIYDRLYRCANRAAGCGAVRACFGIRGSCQKSFQARCEAGRAIFCDLIDHAIHRYDCAGAGLGCRVHPTSGFSARCTGPRGGSPGLDITIDCADGACERTRFGCAAGALNRCAGADLQACVAGRWVTFRCGALGLGACVTTGGWGRCGPPAA